LGARETLLGNCGSFNQLASITGDTHGVVLQQKNKKPSDTKTSVSRIKIKLGFKKIHSNALM
jgi:hypothetical protein